MFFVVSILLTVVAVSAGSFGGAGGGGGGSASSVSNSSGGSSAPNISPSYIVSEAEANVYRSSEYRNQWGLEAIQAAKAYAALAKNGKAVAGDDIKIAIADSGVEADHREIAANIDAANSYNYYENNSDFSDNNGLGTHAAAVAAGVKDGNGIQGVAYNAKIVAADIFNSAASAIDLSDAVGGAASIAGVKIINAGWKYANPNGTFYSSYNGTPSGTNANDNLVIAGLNLAKANDILFIAATGNDADNAADGQFSGQDAAYLTRLKPVKPALFANNNNLSGYVLAVAAVDQFDPYQENPTITIADSSNICGVARNYCLVAPGVNIYAAASDVNIIGGVGADNQKYAAIDGTQAAAAHVSGAAALIRAAWPHLTAAQTSQILISTATHLGTSSTTTADNIYGWGLLNLYAAVQAQGSNNLGYGISVYNQGYDVRDSAVVSDPIFGDAFINNVAPVLNQAIFFDDYGRDYKAFLGNRISVRASNSLVAQLDNFITNKYKTNIIPFNFNEKNQTQIKFQFKTYADNKAKFIIIDNSQEDPNLKAERGFSLRQNFSANSQFGFAFNIDEIKNSAFKNINNFGFISIGSMAANPYQSFVQSNVQSNQNQRNFNQFFFEQNFLQDKFKMGFSLQNSYESANIKLASANKQNQISNFNFSYRPNQRTNFMIQFGEMNEFNNNFLNSKTAGAFENKGLVKTSYLKISALQNLFKDLFLISSFSEGSTKAKGNEIGVFRDYKNIRSRSSAIGLVNENIFGGRIGIIYSEPLRVYKGRATIDIPVDVDAAGNVVRYQNQISLKPKGKERNFELFYGRNLRNNAKIAINFLITKDQGNIKSEHDAYLTMFNYGLVY